MRRHTPSSSAMLLCTAWLTPLLVVGCKHSADQHTFASSQLRPTNVAVVDTLTGRTIWRMEVPIGHELVIDFDRQGLEREGTRISKLPPNELTWHLYEIYKPYDDADHRVGEAVAEQTVTLSDNPLRLQVTYRNGSAISGEGLYSIERREQPTDLQPPSEDAADNDDTPTDSPSEDSPSP